MHIGVFAVLYKVWFQKFTGDVWQKNTIFLQVFKVFSICFQKPLFLMLAFPFVGFVFFILFLLVVVVVGQIKLLCSGSCFWCFGFPSFGSVLCVVFFWFVFGLVFGGGFKGQVRWPKGPPQLALNPPYCFVLFLACFCLFCFSCWVMFASFVFAFVLFGRV